MSVDVLQDGLLQGRLPGRKEFSLYYLELTTAQFHIFDGQDTEMRKHLLSLRIDSSDVAGVETKVRKGEFRFYLNRPGDGKYVFKVTTEMLRDDWINKLNRVITRDSIAKIEGFQPPNRDVFSPDNTGKQNAKPKKFDVPTVPKSSLTRGDSRTLPSRGRKPGSSSVLNTALPPPPSSASGGSGSDSSINSPRASIISTDSGIGTSVGGEIHRPSLHKTGSTSVPSSGSGTFSNRGGGRGGGGPHSADAEFGHRITVSDEATPKWFWGTLSRQDCEERLKTEGEIGNFVVRVNATGHHIMSFWRVDGIHHHKILNHDGLWRFEKAAVTAEGESLADLLDMYMKNCAKDRCIKPFGGALFQNYTYAWTPQEFNMDLLGKKLRQQKELRERARAPRKKEEYTPVEIDTGLNDDEGGFENDPQPGENGPPPSSVIKIKSKNKPLPLPPTKKPNGSSPNSTIKSASRQGPTPPTKPKVSADGDATLSNEQGRAPSQKQGGHSIQTKMGMNFIEELVNKNKGISTEKERSIPPVKPKTSETEAESEPLYANALSQPDSGYQNWDFSGPPPPNAGEQTHSSTGEPTRTVGGEDHSQYQNFTFISQKQPPPQTKKKVAKSGQGNGPNISPKPRKHMNDSGAGINGSLTDNSASVYQNIDFKKQRH